VSKYVVDNGFKEMVTVITNHIITNENIVEVNATTATITLPDLASNKGREIVVTKIAGTAGTVAINAAGTDKITRALLSSVSLTSDGDFWKFRAGSTRWELVDGVMDTQLIILHIQKTYLLLLLILAGLELQVRPNRYL